ncbi:MAG TPA: hypothetical protein VK966_02650, partial [Longimicrobiales bacterium]|nr:hypothetical protein [Longimicrobiales bacterium]
EIVTKVGVPLTKRLADIIGGVDAKPADPAVPPSDVVEAIESLENRMARIEDRLDFLEALKAPDEKQALPSPDAPARGDAD